jgi:hypothetical protein
MNPSRAPRWIASKRAIRILAALLLTILAFARAAPAVAVVPPAAAAAAPVGAPSNYDSILQLSGLPRAAGAMTAASSEGQLTLVSSTVRPSTTTGVAAESGGGRLAGLRAAMADDTGAIGRGLSPNQMNRVIYRGNGPKGIVRIDTPKVPGEQLHATFDDGSALNVDGTWKHGGTTVTNAQRRWLEESGWVVP